MKPPPHTHETHTHKNDPEKETFEMDNLAEFSLVKPLAAIAVSPNHRFVAAGGRDVLKILSINLNGFVLKSNLRTGAKNLKTATNFCVHDVEWSNHDVSSPMLAAGMSSGAVIIWDLERASDATHIVPEKITGEHGRAVNKLSWHPIEHTQLLSGSQDGTVRLWDRRGRSFYCSQTIHPKSGTTRSVQFSPFRPNFFAAAFENGNVKVWDIRMLKQPTILLTAAHSGNVLALDFNPNPGLNGWVLATAGKDHMVKVWDLDRKLPSSGRPEPQHTIHAPLPVGWLKWRPGYPSQIAVAAGGAAESYSDGKGIYLWDVAQQHIPLAVLESSSGSSCTQFQWYDVPLVPSEGTGTGGGNSGGNSAADPEKDQWELLEFGGLWQHLVSCSRDGAVRMRSLAHAQQPMRQVTPSVVALSAQGTLAHTHEHTLRPQKKDGLHWDPRLLKAMGFFYQPPVSTPGFDVIVEQSYEPTANRFSAAAPFNFNDHTPRHQRKRLANELTQPQRGVFKVATKPNPVLHVHKIGGTLGTMDNSCSSEAIAYLADNYVFSGKAQIWEMCQHNAAVALSFGLADAFHIWHMMQILMDCSRTEDLMERDTSQQVVGRTRFSLMENIENSELFSATRSIRGSSYTKDAPIHKLKDRDYNETLTAQTALAILEDDTKGKTDPLRKQRNRRTVEGMPLQWLWKEAVADLILRCAEMGDVQHCVALCEIVALTKENIEDMGINKTRMQEWYMSYIEILQRLGLCQAANELINNAQDQIIQQQNAKSTTIYTACTNCHKPMLGNQSIRCTKCRDTVGKCSFCQQPVHGLYVLCPGCNHGGHLSHLQEWFSYESVCPAGCGHKCNLFPPGIPQSDEV